MNGRKITNNIVDERLIGLKIRRISNVVHARTPILWQCVICSHTWKTSPNKILNQGTGCPKCSNNLLLTNDIVDSKLHDRNLIRFSKIKGTHALTKWKCIICDHEWETTPSNVLNKLQGCPKCAGNARLSNEDIDKKLKERNIQRLENIKGINKPIKWKCLIHNTFRYCSPQSMLKSKFCCKILSAQHSKLNKGGYTKEYFTFYPTEKLIPAILYTIQLIYNSETCIKIGVTKNLNQRLYMYTHSGLRVKLLNTVDLSLFKAFNLEQKILKELSLYKFYPNTRFDGYTECLKYNTIVLEEINNLIKRQIHVDNID